MLPYQEDAKKLENLLAGLFEDDDVIVVSRPFPPVGLEYSCCIYSYSNYDA